MLRTTDLASEAELIRISRDLFAIEDTIIQQTKVASQKPILRYGAKWSKSNEPISDLEIEMIAIQKGGRWKNKRGEDCGEGLFHHYKRFQEICWPEDYHNRWTDLILSEILNNTLTSILGCKDSSKTHSGLVRYGLTDYFCFPNNTLIILSSTTIAAIEGRVWGDMKNMFRVATERFPFLPGHPLESKHAIVTDDLTDDSVMTRDMRRGILVVPCKSSSGSFIGISAYVGMKQERRRYLADEMQFTSISMLDSVANMNSGNFKGVFVGNPIGQDDPLDRVSEPECGWDNHPEPTKTTTWKNKRFLDSRTICLVGTDSPNFDFPDEKCHFKGMINQDGIDRVVAGYGKDSHQYYSQCLGVRKVGLTARRVITRAFCEQFHAFDQVIWEGSKTVKISGLDAAYGGSGGDRCVGGHVEFGLSVDGILTLMVYPPVMVPVSVKNKGSTPEDQISTWAKHYNESNGIPPDNFFYDSTGRGSLGPSLARIWSPNIQPIEFGGAATDRPVSLDIFEYDHKTRTKRLKTCKEHYSKFVTELWWTTRHIIESNQMRGLPQDVCDEGCSREWKEVAGGRIEVEPKSDMKERTGKSPDLYDFLAICCEGARRRGFVISKLGDSNSREQDNTWWQDLRSKSRGLNKRNTLVMG